LPTSCKPCRCDGMRQRSSIVHSKKSLRDRSACRQSVTIGRTTPVRISIADAGTTLAVLIVLRTNGKLRLADNDRGQIPVPVIGRKT
jgi:hypothetical protein